MTDVMEKTKLDGMLAYQDAMRRCDPSDPTWPLPSFDALDWAKAFCDQFPGHDEGTMIGWFANALMRGFDEHERRRPTPTPGGVTREINSDALRDVHALVDQAMRARPEDASWDETRQCFVAAILSALQSARSSDEALRELLADAYEAGCRDTHCAVQDYPDLALMSVENAEFREAADDYAISALRAPADPSKDGEAG